MVGFRNQFFQIPPFFSFSPFWFITTNNKKYTKLLPPALYSAQKKIGSATLLFFRLYMFSAVHAGLL